MREKHAIMTCARGRRVAITEQTLHIASESMDLFREDMQRQFKLQQAKLDNVLVRLRAGQCGKRMRVRCHTHLNHAGPHPVCVGLGWAALHGATGGHGSEGRRVH